MPSHLRQEPGLPGPLLTLCGEAWQLLSSYNCVAELESGPGSTERSPWVLGLPHCLAGLFPPSVSVFSVPSGVAWTTGAPDSKVMELSDLMRCPRIFLSLPLRAGFTSVD